MFPIPVRDLGGGCGFFVPAWCGLAATRLLESLGFEEFQFACLVCGGVGVDAVFVWSLDFK